MTASLPLGASSCSASGSALASVASSSLTAMRSAWKERVAGWMAPGRLGLNLPAERRGAGGKEEHVGVGWRGGGWS